MTSLLDYLKISVVRHPHPVEKIPDWVLDDMVLPAMDPEWVWFATDGPTIKAVLIASPCHGLVQLQRLVVAPGSHLSVVKELFHSASKDVRERGYKLFIVYADPLREEEARLLALARTFGAIESSRPHVVAVGPIPEEAS
jgi:hypothetical protein